jgi:hypothetical protein
VEELIVLTLNRKSKRRGNESLVRHINYCRKNIRKIVCFNLWYPSNPTPLLDVCRNVSHSYRLNPQQHCTINLRFNFLFCIGMYAVNRLTSIRDEMCFLVCINCRLSSVSDKAFCNSDCDVFRKVDKERLLELQNVSRAR